MIVTYLFSILFSILFAVGCGYKSAPFYKVEGEDVGANVSGENKPIQSLDGELETKKKVLFQNIETRTMSEDEEE